MFVEAFEEEDTYSGFVRSWSYFDRLLVSDHFIVIVALANENAVRELAEYELPKREQEPSEIDIYDRAVALEQRLRGVEAALIEALKETAANREACVFLVQVYYGDYAAIAL